MITAKVIAQPTVSVNVQDTAITAQTLTTIAQTGVDPSQTTVTAESMLDGITAIDASGELITGTIPVKALSDLWVWVSNDQGIIKATARVSAGAYPDAERTASIYIPTWIGGVY